MLQDTLFELAAERKLRNVSPTVATFALFGMILWISRWYRRDGKLTAQEALRDIRQVAVSAVLKNEASPSSRDLAASRTTLVRKKVAR